MRKKNASSAAGLVERLLLFTKNVLFANLCKNYLFLAEFYGPVYTLSLPESQPCILTNVHALIGNRTGQIVNRFSVICLVSCGSREWRNERAFCHWPGGWPCGPRQPSPSGVTLQAGAGRTALFAPTSRCEQALRTHKTEGDREGVFYEGLGLMVFLRLGC